MPDQQQKSLRQQMLDRMSNETDAPPVRYAMDSLGCISHIGRGGSFDEIKDRIKTDLVDCHWVEALSGAMLFAEACDSPYVAELRRLVTFVDEIVFGPQS